RETDIIKTKICIYEQLINWVLERHIDSDISIGKENLRHFLTETALCVVQSGNESANIPMLEERLANNNIIAESFLQARSKYSDQTLNHALTTFYFHQNTIEFTHRSFSEFLFADLLNKNLEHWSKEAADLGQWEVPNNKLYKQIYELLGYGVLRQEIVEYLIALLTQNNNFDANILFKRLEKFYFLWCNGEFINKPPEENLVQKKMLQFQRHKIILGLQQVDLYAGLNVLILLFELDKYAQRFNASDAISFYACGKPYTDKFEAYRLRRIISYCQFIRVRPFSGTMSSFLCRVKLIGGNLSSLDLYQANLCNANLSEAKLISTDLIYANLSQANLTSADLNRADLIGADLCCADLSNANLRRADLSNANLSNANLSNANFYRANLSDTNLNNITWNEYTNWENVRGLETAENVPEALKKQLGIN
ncbi:MAG: pentapeptide repeat-containing protein, partial [Phormidium sp.]